MPAPRYTITDTGTVADLLDRAARCWPDVADRELLLMRLVEAGGETLARDRLAAIDETAGVLTGAYRHDALGRLRGDWPD